MKKDKIIKPSAVYKLLEFQMTILTTLFGFLSIVCGIIPYQTTYIATILGLLATVCGLLIYKYSCLKSEAEEIEKKKEAREMKWTDENKDLAAIRFVCYHGAEDLGFLYGTVKITKETGGKGFQNGDFNILAKEAELYLPEGSYKVELMTREYQNTYLDIHIADTEIGQRKWYTINLVRKKSR